MFILWFYLQTYMSLLNKMKLRLTMNLLTAPRIHLLLLFLLLFWSPCNIVKYSDRKCTLKSMATTLVLFNDFFQQNCRFVRSSGWVEGRRYDLINKEDALFQFIVTIRDAKGIWDLKLKNLKLVRQTANDTLGLEASWCICK